MCLKTVLRSVQFVRVVCDQGSRFSFALWIITTCRNFHGRSREFDSNIRRKWEREALGMGLAYTGMAENGNQYRLTQTSITATHVCEQLAHRLLVKPVSSWWQGRRAHRGTTPRHKQHWQQRKFWHTNISAQKPAWALQCCSGLAKWAQLHNDKWQLHQDCYGLTGQQMQNVSDGTCLLRK